MPNTKPYPYITAWGQYMGSKAYFIEDQIALARAEGAPARAIYKEHPVGEATRGTGPGSRWATVDGIKDDDLRAKLIAAVEGKGGTR